MALRFNVPYAPFKNGAFVPHRSKALLLDMDGVILHHPKASALIKGRVEKFIETILDMPPEEAIPINKFLYQSYGHTTIGLEKIYNKQVSIKEFNANVYDPHTMLIAQYLSPEEETFEQGREVRELVQRCFEEGIPTYIFSNAPMVWCQWASWLLRLNNLIPVKNMITCDHLNGGFLKPDPNVYDFVAGMIRTDDLLFIDDTLINLPNAPRWTCFHKPPPNSPIGPYKSPNIHRIQRFADVYPYI